MSRPPRSRRCPACGDDANEEQDGAWQCVRNADQPAAFSHRFRAVDGPFMPERCQACPPADQPRLVTLGPGLAACHRGHTWWLDDGTCPPRPGRKQVKHLSPSSANVLDECPARYEFAKVLGVPEPRGRPATLGVFVHLVLESLAGLPKPGRSIDAARRIAGDLWVAAVERRAEAEMVAARLGVELGDVDDVARSIKETSGDAKTFKRDVWQCLVEAVAVEREYGGDVAFRELKCETTVGGVPFNGKVDRVDRVAHIGLQLVDYKGLAVDTPIPTPGGWSTMGALAEGDTVFGSDGAPARVVAKSEVHHRPCYRVRFDDGASVVCDDEHLWLVDVRDRGGNGRSFAQPWTEGKVVSAVELAGLLDSNNVVRVRSARPLDLPAADLPLDPWLLGAWLGDGRSRGGEITLGDTDRDWFEAEIARRGERLVSVRHESVGSVQATVAGLTARLRPLGVLNDKHVPAAYLRASAAQRLDLLRGLMDTDGSWNPQCGRAVFVNTRRPLAEAVRELVVGLGWRCSWFEKPYQAKRGGRTVFMLSFRPDAPVFLLPRKAAQQEASMAPRSKHAGYMARASARYVKECAPEPTVPTQCIAVDSPDSTYLCGVDMVPTHNTGKAVRAGGDERAQEKYEHASRQLHLYWRAVEAVTGERVGGALLSYVSPGGRTVVTVDGAGVDATVAWFAGLWADRQSYELAAVTDGASYPARPSFLCGWCPFVNRCRSGSAWLLELWSWAENYERQGRGVVPAMALVKSWPAEKRTRWREWAEPARGEVRVALDASRRRSRSAA